MATATNEKQQQKTETPPEPVASKGAVAIFEKPRLPFHPAIEERFADIGVNKGTWKALVESVFPAAKTADAVVLALSYCKARRLDPFKRVVHIVPIWDSNKDNGPGVKKGGWTETVWPGIAEHRTTAFRTGEYAGADPAAVGPMIEHTFSTENEDGTRRNVMVRFPEWCQITVYRMCGAQRVPYPGPRCYWMEYYSRQGRTIMPNDRWQRAPNQMLEKCAEAAALRRAFPEELGDEPTDVESGHYGRDAVESAVDVTPARPTRAQFREPAQHRAESGGESADADGVIEGETVAAETPKEAQAAPNGSKSEPAVAAPASPLSLSGKARDAAWPSWSAWFKASLRATPKDEIATFMKAHAKEWAFICENRVGDMDEISLILEDRSRG